MLQQAPSGTSDLVQACSKFAATDLTAESVAMHASLLRLTDLPAVHLASQDKGMVFSALDFPPGLDLLVFSQGATMRGLRTVPLPILKKVGAASK